MSNNAWQPDSSTGRVLVATLLAVMKGCVKIGFFTPDQEENMDKDINPYAPPTASLKEAGIEDYWAEGKILVVRQDDCLPERCVKCNEPALLPIKARTLYYHHWAWYLLILLNIIIYAVLALIVRKKVIVYPGLCAKHRTERLLALWIGLPIFLGSIFWLIAAIFNSSVLQIGASIVLVVVSFIFGVLRARLLVPIKVNDQYVRLRGAGKAFLDSLPQQHK